jgi:hypothetical protein
MGHNFMLITTELLPPLIMFLPLRERWEERVIKLLKTAIMLLDIGHTHRMEQHLCIPLTATEGQVPTQVLLQRPIMLFLRLLLIFTRTVSITLLVVT